MPFQLDEQAPPDEQAQKREDPDRLARAVAELPLAQREAIVLHHLQGLPLADYWGVPFLPAIASRILASYP